MSVPSPPELGLPPKFDQWRDTQWEAIDDGVLADERFTAQSVPTGGGKSLIYITQSHLTGGRTAYLTATKGLQDQLTKDFSSHLRMASIKGKSNYDCSSRPGWTCQDGHTGRCPFKGTVRCSFSADLFNALAAPNVVTNYSFWMAQHKYGTGLGEFDRLVLDEAHAAFDELSGAMQIQLGTHEVEEMCKLTFPPVKDDLAKWKKWASISRQEVVEQAKRLKSKIDTAIDVRQQWVKDHNHMRNLVRKLGTLATIIPADWIVDDWEHGFQFDPIRLSRYAESMLFLNIPRVSLFSATIRPKNLQMVGIYENFKFKEYPSVFDPDKNPVYHVDTIWVNKDTTDQEMQVWMMRADQVIQRRLDRKGIFHTVSFLRRDRVINNSDFSRIMISNKKGEITEKTVQQFLKAPSPAVLVSPSVSTGYDFMYDACRYQIIGKVPWPDISTKLMKARMQLDPQLPAAIASQQFMQMAGRSRRAKDDWSENIVLDNGVVAFMRRNASMFPQYFHRSFKQVGSIPPPPEM